MQITRLGCLTCQGAVSSICLWPRLFQLIHPLSHSRPSSDTRTSLHCWELSWLRRNSELFVPWCKFDINFITESFFFHFPWKCHLYRFTAVLLLLFLTLHRCNFYFVLPRLYLLLSGLVYTFCLCCCYLALWSTLGFVFVWEVLYK